ncbi:MAG: sce7726 family protein [Candidatus Kapabacteria bacterium]|nr:sce7726 family protein [Candidatus Kapabacteria bacterium]
MREAMNYQIDRLRDYSSLFSRNQALSWLKMDFSSINYKIERYDDKWLNSQNLRYLDYLRYVYSVLVDNYQNEYVFKNEFLNNWLIKELGETNSQIFSEFRVGNSIADLVMFNGCSKIFEIKTELDSDSRLTLQLENYQKAFNQIFLIIPKSKVHVYEKQDDSVGLITYDPASENLFSIYRNATRNLDIDTSVTMSILHTNEYKSIVRRHYGYLPQMTSFNQFKVCSELIFEIPKEKLNKLFIDEIKKRNSTDALSSRYYKEFNQLFLALKMNRNSKREMIESLKTNIQI